MRPQPEPRKKRKEKSFVDPRQLAFATFLEGAVMHLVAKDEKNRKKKETMRAMADKKLADSLSTAATMIKKQFVSKACDATNLNLRCGLATDHDGQHETSSGLAWNGSALMCEHANENPGRVCPCKAGCYCKVHTCQKRWSEIAADEIARIDDELIFRPLTEKAVAIYTVTHRFEQSMWLCVRCAKRRERRGEDIRWRGFLDPSFACDDCKRTSPRGKLRGR